MRTPRTKRLRSKKEEDSKEFFALAKWIERKARGRLRRTSQSSLLIRASLSKAYEFNLMVRGGRNQKDAFFWSAALRGICEDLIVFRFLGNLTKSDRELLVQLFIEYELLERTTTQHKFFSKVRPQQRVLLYDNVEEKRALLENRLKEVWQRIGWPRFDRGAMPPIRQLAERQGIDVLSVLYDYLYRLTSGTVHFNVQSLLRSGWGSPRGWHFSTRNFYRYHSDFSTVYGAFLFCLYFEFFPKILRPTRSVSRQVNSIRSKLITKSRWPEMVTFEEMNLPSPGINFITAFATALQATKHKKLLRLSAPMFSPEISELLEKLLTKPTDRCEQATKK
jgi:hypothetical protein